MKKNFWQKFKKPFYALAPMAGITDVPMRYLCGRFGADVVYSEMVSATALCYESDKTLDLMKSYRKNGGAKFVVQLFGNNPDHFAQAVKVVEKKIKPDGIDINFGCPVAKIQRSGSGVKLFQDLDQSRRVIESCLRNTSLPLSVKIRIAAGKVSALDFIEKMKDLDISAIMIHGRTLAQGFVGEVDFAMINRCKKKFKGIVIANGGIENYEQACEMLKKTGADGIGIGQGACGKPQIFKEMSKKFQEFSKPEIFKIILEHSRLVHKLKGDYGILEMRKHLCWYVKGMDGAAEMRKQMVGVNTLAEIKKILKNIKNN